MVDDETKRRRRKKKENLKSKRCPSSEKSRLQNEQQRLLLKQKEQKLVLKQKKQKLELKQKEQKLALKQRERELELERESRYKPRKKKKSKKPNCEKKKEYFQLNTSLSVSRPLSPTSYLKESLYNSPNKLVEMIILKIKNEGTTAVNISYSNAPNSNIGRSNDIGAVKKCHKRKIISAGVISAGATSVLTLTNIYSVFYNVVVLVPLINPGQTAGGNGGTPPLPIFTTPGGTVQLCIEIQAKVQV
jgi:hypothetical protein